MPPGCWIRASEAGVATSEIGSVLAVPLCTAVSATSARTAKTAILVTNVPFMTSSLLLADTPCDRLWCKDAAER